MFVGGGDHFGIAHRTARLDDRLDAGGSSGIGEATVERFVAEGAKVTIADIQDDAGEALARRLGESALYVRTDVTDEAAIENVVARTAEHFGRYLPRTCPPHARDLG